MKNMLTFLVAFLLSMSLFATDTYVAQLPTHSTPKTRISALQFGSFASFNDSYTQCVGQDGNYYWGAVFQTFAPVNYTPCQSQMFSDLDYLSQHHIQSIRLWPVLSTFAYDANTQTWSSSFNSNIANLDQYLARLAQNNMKAYITLMATPDCSDPLETGANLGYYFNPALIKNPTTQNQFMQAFKAFITRYKNNPAISGYDLVNELSLIFANPPTRTSKGYCNLPYDTSSFPKTRAFVTRMYTEAKEIDTQHAFTYSFDQLYAPTSPVFAMMRSDVDFYDFHAYANDPQTFYQNYASYDKPVIHGEVGVFGTQYDHNGNNCEGTGINTDRNVLPAMVPECQSIWLKNAQAFVQQAKLHNISALFFQLWPSTKAYGIRTYDGNNTFTGYQLTSAGQYIFNLNSF